jgi:dTDP-4-amino-4,6-dideoxygalactose transaminase
MIPFVDLKAQYKNIQDKIDEAISNVIKETAFIGGSIITEFEKNFADYIDVKHCVSCANGTDSLEILLKSMGIGNGDEVIVPAISWISTSECVSSVGATPVFVDIDPNYFTINLNLVEEKINKNTKAIIPVHLYGQAVDMPKLMAIAKKHKLKVVEDCAQAHGAEFNNQKVGSFGDCASFSFYPGKNLGAYGDAGCMITNNNEIAEKARMIANHGQKGKHNHIIEGRNSRMDGIHAAVLNVKLKYLYKWTDRRINIANQYNEQLSNSLIIKPKLIEGGKHVYHLYVIRIKDRDRLKMDLSQKGISSAIHYPTALPFLECYKHMNHKALDFPIASKVQNEIISIPMFPELTNDEIIYITNFLNKYN